MIYLDNASTTIHKPKEVIDNVVFGLTNMGNSGRGVNEVSIRTSKIIFETREKIANFFNIKDSSRVAFTSNATESLNIAIKGLINQNDHVISTEIEHNSVLRPLYELEKKGVEITFLKKEEVFQFDLEKMKKYIKKNTKAFICTHASNLTGDILDVKNIGKFCSENNILFILDAAQSAGVIPIDVISMKIDVLCFTGHKGLMGPQGIGGIYVRESIPIKSYNTGGSGINTYSKSHSKYMPDILEAGTLNGHGIIGLGAGIDFINKIGIEKIYEYEKLLMIKFYEGIKNNKNIKIYGKFYEENKLIKRIPIVSLNVGELNSGDVSSILSDSYEIITRGGGHCAPLMHKALGTVDQGVVRFSFSYFNKNSDVEKAIKALNKIST